MRGGCGKRQPHIVEKADYETFHHYVRQHCLIFSMTEPEQVCIGANLKGFLALFPHSASMVQESILDVSALIHVRGKPAAAQWVIVFL